MKIQKIIFFAILIFAFQNFSAQQKADDLLASAKTQAAKEHKNVLLVFHASWCGWCKLMEKNMNLPETKSFFDKNFVTTYIDVQERGEKKNLENPGGQELMNRLKGEEAGLPFWLVINPKGEVLTDSFDDKGENLGSPATKEEVEFFVQKLKKVTALSSEQEQSIRAVFAKKDA